jgi:hypothetical protein
MVGDCVAVIDHISLCLRLLAHNVLAEIKTI